MQACRAQLIGRSGRGLDRRAFTMVELVMVILIISIFSAIAIPRYGNSLALRRADGAARRIAADFEFARRHAMTVSSAQKVQWESDKNTGYTLAGLPHPDHPDQPYTVLLDRDCFGAEAVGYSFGGDDQFTFDIYGVPDSAGKLAIRVGDHVRTVLIYGTTGEVTVSEGDVDAPTN